MFSLTDPPTLFFPQLKKTKLKMEKKLPLDFGNFAIVYPVCTTCYHKGLQPAIINKKQKSRRLELMCDINLNENWLTPFLFFNFLLP